MRQTPIALGTRYRRLHRMHAIFDSVDFSGLRTVFEAIQRSFSLWRQRRALDLLDDRLLKDVGLTQFDVDRELRKPFWRI